MAKLMKLHISGIRSFGPFEDQTQQLKFTSPLTLILGQNGCGKTTIIEAVKYACSGELPGGTNSGQGFINDPKMTSKLSTKGQIKLKILDLKGNEVTFCRVMEVIQSGSGLKFQSKSATVRRVGADGDDKSISGRCADISGECCQIMNVSPAVLNNVIFCHQENSAWPLDEGKKLKEKFDEIFDAQKYNRCTDIFRKQLKEKQDKIKMLKMEVSYKLEKKQLIDKQKRVLQGKEDRLRSFEDDIRNQNAQLDPLQNRIDEILKLERDLSDLDRELTTKETTKKGVIEEQNTIKKNLSFEFEGDDDILRERIKSFSKNREKDENFIVELDKRKSEIESKSELVASKMQEVQTQLGELKHEEKQHREKCVKRKNLLENAKTKMEVKIFGDFNDHNTAKKALQDIKTVLDCYAEKLETLIKEKDEEENALQRIVDEARENSVRTEHTIESKTKQLKECDQNIAEIDNELANLASSDEYLKACQKKIEGIDKTIYSLNNAFKETEESQKTEDYKRDIQNMEKNLEKLEADYKVLLQNDVVEGKLESEKRIIMEKQREVNRIKTKHFDNLNKLFGETVPEKNLKDAVSTLQTKSDLTAKSLTEKINKKQKEVTTLHVQRQNQLEKILNSENDLKRKKEKISEACDGRDFNETLETSFQKKEKLQWDKGQYSSVKVIFGQYIKEFEKESPCCPICETNFRNRNDAIRKIISTLKTKLESVPQKLTAVEDELEKEEALYDKLQQLKLVNDEIDLLNTQTLPSMKQQLEEIEQSLNKEKTELEELKTQLEEPQKIIDVSRAVISDVASLDQHQADLERSKRNVENLKGDLVKIDSNKSKQEVEAEIDFIKSEMQELRRKVDAQVKKISNHKDRVQQLTQERIVLVEKRIRLQEGIQSKPALEKQKVELEEKKLSLNEEILNLCGNRCLVEEELKNAIENKEKITSKNKQEIQEERDRISANMKMFDDLEKLEQEIDDYVNQKVDEKLTATDEKLRDLQNKDETLKQTKTKIIEAISEKKEEIAKHELNFRTLKDNALLREKKSLENGLETEIQALKKRIGGYNYRTVYAEKRQLSQQRENLEKQINNLIGEKNGLLTTIEELRQELSSPESKQAYQNYMSKYYELKIAERVFDDLRNYVEALEKAVLDFHKSKMIQINKNIRELWRDTYRGNDIDYIEIKTEHGTSSTKKRTYNYKVVQVKKGVELDMRGRCSAGQKVLACLIIRMALAETLSSNCGILALDEPTTNLDRENVRSLSDTLSRIVQARQMEKNFQLLIITHDEEFLNMLTRVQGVSYYYKVMRNEEGFSVINKEYAL